MHVGMSVFVGIKQQKVLGPGVCCPGSVAMEPLWKHWRHKESGSQTHVPVLKNWQGSKDIIVILQAMQGEGADESTGVLFTPVLA